MSFANQLETIYREVPGCQGVLVMGLDGISVASHLGQKEGLDVETLLIELAGPIRGTIQAMTNGQSGDLQEWMVSSSLGTILLRMLSVEHFAAMFLGPSAIIGKGRYVLRRYSLPLIKELS